ncbi:acyltransferase family protein [Halochromatium roseum]|uniref:acyltransferase family protein n=1 Tax=Halochromatium roseum TaxID=391920 RepID=UPI00191499B9|nr:acyltransferase [Halochromatium roseum]MBK5940370.1 hypothetical protein [Halochromatium roseum]
MANAKHQDFIDLMKVLGMLLIVAGHIIGDPQNAYNLIAQPAFTKQIGVAFFVFITGWGLANNQRPAVRAVFNRIFPFYFWGIFFALLLSLINLYIKGDANLSNYIPFFFGANVFLNYFPANPTTWYIGAYLHILLFWFLFLKGRRVGLSLILAAFIVESCVRSLLIYLDQNFVAYMILPNWITVFMLGMYLHNKQQSRSLPIAFGLLFLWAVFLGTWAALSNLIPMGGSFPFQTIKIDSPLAVPIESVMISIIYIVNTYFFFEIARRLRGHRIISYFARATLIMVIVHMPIIYSIHDRFYTYFDNRQIAQIILIGLVYVASAVIANVLQKFIDITALRELSWKYLSSLYAHTFKK